MHRRQNKYPAVKMILIWKAANLQETQQLQSQPEPAEPMTVIVGRAIANVGRAHVATQRSIAAVLTLLAARRLSAGLATTNTLTLQALRGFWDSLERWHAKLVEDNVSGVEQLRAKG